MGVTVAKAPPQVAPETRSEPCDVCGAPTFELHCRVMCRTCGYVRDCSDP